MNEQMLVRELQSSRRRSMKMAPVAIAIFAIFFGVVWLEGLHLSDIGFLPGILVGALAYWAVLEVVTVVRMARLLRQYRIGAIRP